MDVQRLRLFKGVSGSQANNRANLVFFAPFVNPFFGNDLAEIGDLLGRFARNSKPDNCINGQHLIRSVLRCLTITSSLRDGADIR